MSFSVEKQVSQPEDNVEPEEEIGEYLA